MAAPPQAAGPEPQEAPLAGLVANVSGNVQKYAVKKKKILNAEELELYELTQAAGVVIDQEVFKVIVDLLKMNVAPLAVFQMLKSMCAGHRLTETLTSESASTTTQPSGLESRGRNKPNPALQAERSSREGSSQRMSRQSSATRLQKSGSAGKNAGGSSTQT
ncbi:mitotic-spindle organizing protein 2 isoform X6 [Latimeria chalumnae]|uniref:Mitotic spindle organizing protein 2B n=1 Tax=Latimeria chalumnae TaxID=7897 RepID=M3XIL7_LATCH|nr:PREDICTED: mitotic-spindle organizing protein 2B-like isoform X6 [Latimeria chalumnae]|eukprot:XP_005990317.1 PREDICTED: mitotic-spindle organizing protein 2B-like isoform X6 [Latimeria chalumnae]